MVPLRKRSPKRSRLFQTADLWVGDWHSRARVRDLSLTGAFVESEDAAPANSIVLLMCDMLTVQGKVAWVDEKRFGMEFDVPPTRDVVDEVRRGNLVLSAPRAYRPDSLELDEEGDGPPFSPAGTVIRFPRSGR